MTLICDLRDFSKYLLVECLFRSFRFHFHASQLQHSSPYITVSLLQLQHCPNIHWCVGRPICAPRECTNAHQFQVDCGFCFGAPSLVGEVTGKRQLTVVHRQHGQLTGDEAKPWRTDEVLLPLSCLLSVTWPTILAYPMLFILRMKSTMMSKYFLLLSKYFLLLSKYFCFLLLSECAEMDSFLHCRCKSLLNWIISRLSILRQFVNSF